MIKAKKGSRVEQLINNGWLTLEYDGGTDHFWNRAKALSFIRNSNKILIFIPKNLVARAMMEKIPDHFDIATCAVTSDMNDLDLPMWYTWYSQMRERSK